MNCTELTAFATILPRTLAAAMAQAWPEQRQAAVGAKHVDEGEHAEDRSGYGYERGVAHAAGASGSGMKCVA